MNRYRVVDIFGSFGLFLDEEYEGKDSIDVKEAIMNEIIDNIGNYVEVFTDGLECCADRYDEFKDEVHKKIDEEVIKYLDKNIQKLENGFVYKNNYYETFEEIKEKIEEEGKENEEVNGT